MRKTSVRRFIHAVLDVLPLLIIPIFALNILHKETEPISIEVQENIKLNYSQYVENYNSRFTTNGNQSITFQQDLTFNQNHYYLWFWYQEENYTSIERNTPMYQVNTTNYYYLTTENQNLSSGTYYWRFQYTGATASNVALRYWTANGSNANAYTNINLFDLTQIYGVGNEPDVNTFMSQFNELPYAYTLNKDILIEGQTITYNDTDIGSQFVYALYKPVHEYFNFNNLFNMGAIYNWIELNLFSGTAQLPIFIIWNVIVYEFFIDLIFLMYSLFMFIIDWSTNMIDKFLYKSRS